MPTNNPMTYCDLHIHSSASDGTVPPEELAPLAVKAGLAAIALTDHDTTVGVPAAQAACQKVKLNFVPGIELSVRAPALDENDPGSRLGTLHILGYFIQHDHPDLLTLQQQVQQARHERNPRMIDRLRELGVAIEYEDVLELARSEGALIVGRPHIAQVLVQKGYVKSLHEAFRRYIGQGAPAYIRKDLLPPEEAIRAIHAAKGLAILAHPLQLRLPDFTSLHREIQNLKAAGLDGIEARHTDHTPAHVRQFEQMAKQLNLLTTGGSDFHGARKAIPLGSQKVPYEYYERLRQAAGQ
ncbi:MAG: PHP domain-containing protein [Phycisphaeraceae bacterium]|nr:PHP domain-containing protein [Phycisphaeraceae bacterium]